MRYPFIDAEKVNYPVVILCRVMCVSRAGFYAWKNRPPSRRALEDKRLRSCIREIHSQSRRTYGVPRIFKVLRNDGNRVGLHRIERLCREDGVRACYKRKYRVTTQSDHILPVAKNILNREFKPTAPNRVWAGDITYIATNEGWLYLATVLDLYSRRVIGWSMGTGLKSSLVKDALRMALGRRGSVNGVLHHSDRGVQYASSDYQEMLDQKGLRCSMSRKGNCWDNAVVESFFKTLKVECVYRQKIQTREQARQMIFEYIEVFYNRQRIHSTLDYRSPVDYERECLAA